jgi:FMN phosphatase YigB (HAD superfamily)
VGDSYFADVVGAQRAGIRPVLFDPHGVFDGWPPEQAQGGLAPAIIRSHTELLTLLDGRD